MFLEGELDVVKHAWCGLLFIHGYDVEINILHIHELIRLLLFLCINIESRPIIMGRLSIFVKN